MPIFLAIAKKILDILWPIDTNPKSTSYSFKKGDYEAMNRYLHQIDIAGCMKNRFLSIADKAETLITILKGAIEKFVDKCTIRKSYKCPWNTWYLQNLKN